MPKLATKAAKKQSTNTAAKTKAGVKVRVKKLQSKGSVKKSVKVRKERETRLQILQHIAESTDLAKVQVEKVFLSLVDVMKGHLKKRGSGQVTIPFTGIKIKAVRKKSRKSRKMVSPLTGTEVEIAAKPARRAVKVVALKTLKDMVED